PLHLSPYIARGEIGKARSLSKVKDPCRAQRGRVCDVTIPESFSGFITVDNTLGKHMFFWFFPSQVKPDAPVSIWLNGGPGVTSMSGLFWENGPLQPRRRKVMDAFIPEEFDIRNSSWSDALSMLYIDNPVGAGYSYQERGNPEDLPTQASYTEDLYQFVEQFYQLFPDLFAKELYIGGQSYAAKYVTSLAYRVHQAVKGGQTRLHLAGIYLGSPFFAPEVIIPAQAEFLYSMGAMTRTQANRHRASMMATIRRYTAPNKGLTGQQTRGTPSTSAILEELFFKGLPSNDNYVSVQAVVPYAVIHRIMTSGRIRRAVHAGNLTFHAINYDLHDRMGQDYLLSTSDKLGALLDSGQYKVLIFNGDLDPVTSSGAVEDAVLQIPWMGMSDYASEPRRVWKWPATPENLEVSSLFGFFTKSRDLCRVVVHRAGHQVPHDQLAISRQMMEQFVNVGCVFTWP
ncbi:hypothetical protein EGW08_022009, partial [Elysia chlorotica]